MKYCKFPSVFVALGFLVTGLLTLGPSPAFAGHCTNYGDVLPYEVDPTLPLPCLTSAMSIPAGYLVTYKADGDLVCIDADGRTRNRCGMVTGSNEAVMPLGRLTRFLVTQGRDMTAYWYGDVLPQ